MSMNMVLQLSIILARQLLNINSDGIEEIEENPESIDVSLKLLQNQIRIAQELAIAKRIETADEVEIEEFYDNQKEGNIGIKGDNNGVNIGLNGHINKITKRVYRFKGYNDKQIEAYEQALDTMFSQERD